MAKSKQKTEVTKEESIQVNEIEINKTEPVDNTEKTAEIETTVEKKTTKKIDSPFDNELWDKISGISEEQYNFISIKVKDLNPKFCLEAGFGSGCASFAVLNSSSSVEKYLALDIKLDEKLANKFSDKYKSFSVKKASSTNTNTFIDSEFPVGIDLFIVDIDANYESILLTLNSSVKWVNNGGIIIVNGWGVWPDVDAACNDFLFRNRMMVRKGESSNGLLTITVNRGLFRSPTS